MRVARFRRCCAGSIFVGATALAGCATTGEQVYVAPTDQTVTPRLEAAWDGKGQHIIVEGRIVDAVTGTPLKGAVARIGNTGVGAVSSESGELRIRGFLSPGEYPLLFGRCGYLSRSSSVRITGEQPVQIGTVRLQPSEERIAHPCSR